MGLKITPEYLAGYFDACGSVRLTYQSEWNPTIEVAFVAKRKRVVEAACHATSLGAFTATPADGGGYVYRWVINDIDEIAQLLYKMRDHVVIYHDLVESILTWYAEQQRYDDFMADPRRGVMAHTISNAKLAKVQAVTLMVRTINDFKQS